MKILLVYPEYPETFWSFKYALPFISRKASFPPLGLLTVAGLLPDDWSKKLVDMAVTALRDEDIVWADYVFISAMSIQRESAKKAIDRCKKLGAKIVAGGPLFTTDYEDFPEVDHLILGEAEIALPQFIKDLEAGPKRLYASVEHADLSGAPIPLWRLINPRKYASLSLQYSRGCPFNCDFCNITSLFGHRVRLKSNGQLIAELESIYALGWRGSIFFVDDNFIGNKAILKAELLPAITAWQNERKRPFILHTQASINLADDEELMRLMVGAGFNAVFIGIETPDEESLAECGKAQNKNRDLLADIKKIQAFGLEVQGGFILGFDNDDPVSIFDRLTLFIQKSGIAMAMVGLLSAPRGTKLWERLAKEKRLFEERFSGNNTDCSTNIIPKMNLEILVEGYKKVVRTLYAPQPYYERAKTFLKNFKPLEKKGFQFRFNHLSAFIKSIWFLGIRERGRWCYWKLLFWSLFRKPRLLPQAVTMLIHGFHFRKVFGEKN